MAEGAPLLREYGVYSLIEGSNPSLSETKITCKRYTECAPVAQLDRVPGYELGGRRFESFRARQLLKNHPLGGFFLSATLNCRI